MKRDEHRNGTLMQRRLKKLDGAALNAVLKGNVVALRDIFSELRRHVDPEVRDALSEQLRRCEAAIREAIKRMDGADA